MDTQPVYFQQLSEDAVLAPLLASITPRQLKRRNNVCLRLCASIMSQQLSTKVADVIFKRFLELYGKQEPTHRQIQETPHEVLRSIGLSNAKAHYVHNVAGYFGEHNINDDHFDQLTNEQVIEMLTSIKGVGKWTAEMLLMFTLGREDVFAADDLVIQQGMARLYGLDMANKKEFRKQIVEISARWAPFRTYGCFYIWDSKV